MIKLPHLLALSLACLIPAQAIADIGSLSAQDAHIKVQRGEVVLVDVRTPSEWETTGLPQDSIGIPLESRNFMKQMRGAVMGDLDHPVALICRADNCSDTAAKRLRAAGFTSVYNIPEGMTGRDGVGEGWITQELPTYRYIPRAR